ncbi:hypothetical protein GXP67_07780 [Rhodocytophaga rosea]|uniref:Uncharacterized protein n=1 Tax=Rhodocytophaga rosea TaxID=2704465 RepID=A0A6C0GEY5_9BACT|nr:hypothetical protein [Rhodocytophaga rosea]QHT66561.1 hypothetical protein GXP67_07780 [Rhodocytophaga rosea]
MKAKKGSLNPSTVQEIPLALSKENVKWLLKDIINGQSKYTHFDFAEWCYRQMAPIIQQDIELEDIGIESDVWEVICDVDAQWELFLVNTLPHQELIRADFSQVRLPLDWFSSWYKKLEK